jgi:formiminotetrahydrofolate cyclodeaminase
VPLGVAERAAEVERIARALKPITHPNMKSDLTTAIALANAAIVGAIANVEINLEAMEPESAGGQAFLTQGRSRAAALKSEATLTPDW